MAITLADWMEANRSYRPWKLATHDEIETYAAAYEAVRFDTGLSLDHSRVWGKSLDAMQAEAKRVKTQWKRRA